MQANNSLILGSERVLGTLYADTIKGLKNYSVPATYSAIATTDTVDVAFGKLQKQINSITTLIGSDTDDSDTKINQLQEVYTFLSDVSESDTILTKFATLDTTLTISGAKTFNSVTTFYDLVYINLDQDVGKNLKGSLVIGIKTGNNIGIDGNEIQARNNSNVSDLFLNYEGASNTVHIGNSTLGGTTQPIYLNLGVLTAGTALGTMAYESKGSYLPLSGSTMQGPLNFKNNTWNLVGDDCYIGDYNRGGHVGFKGNNANTGIGFIPYTSGWNTITLSQTAASTMTLSGSLVASSFIGNLNNTLTFAAGAFSAKTYDNSSAQTINIPTHTSHLTNDSGFITKDASDLTNYVKKSGDIMTGVLATTCNATHTGLKVGYTYINAIAGEVIFQNNTAIRFGNDAWDWNQWAGLSYTHSDKTVHLGIANSSGNSNFTKNNELTGGIVNFPGVSTLDMLKTASIKNLPVNGGIYWNPYVESDTDSSDVASITVNKNVSIKGKTGTVLKITLQNDSTDTILFVTHANSTLYHNSSAILTEANEMSSNVTEIILDGATGHKPKITPTTTWANTGITNADLPAGGTYIVLMYVHDSGDSQWYMFYSGVMSWNTTNKGVNDTDSDEILLHASGHAYGKRLYLRTLMHSATDSDTNVKGKVTLQIASDVNFTGTETITFKFKQIL